MNTANALHRDWSAEATGEGNGDGAYTQVFSSSTSSFTAINQPSAQFPTPQSPMAAPIQQNQARRRASVHGRRRHNPAVAQYLGLGTASEPTHLERYASSPATSASPPRRSTRKRTKLAAPGDTSDGRHTSAEARGVANQQRVSESFRVTKPVRKSAASSSKAALSRTAHSASNDNVQSQHSTADGDGTAVSDHIPPTQACDVTHRRFASSETVQNVSQDTVATLPVQHPGDARLFDLEDDDHDTTEAGQVDCNLDLQQHQNLNFADDDFDFDIGDDELLALISEGDGRCPDLVKPTPESHAQSYDTVDYRLRSTSGSCADVPTKLGEVATKTSSQQTPKQFVSPVTLTTRLHAYGNPGFAKIPKPIVRPPFPEPVRDRSPIIGLSSNLMLRTCFRIGEVINQSCQASKSGKHIIIEMYARILASERTGTEQQFTFCDLFHTRPPYIKGSYSAAIWKSVELFEYDCSRLLQQGRICRCIGTMKREGNAWAMTVLNIWEATWEDIEWVEAIVNS